MPVPSAATRGTCGNAQPLAFRRALQQDRKVTVDEDVVGEGRFPTQAIAEIRGGAGQHHGGGVAPRHQWPLCAEPGSGRPWLFRVTGREPNVESRGMKSGLLRHAAKTYRCRAGVCWGHIGSRYRTTEARHADLRGPLHQEQRAGDLAVVRVQQFDAYPLHGTSAADGVLHAQGLHRHRPGQFQAQTGADTIGLPNAASALPPPPPPGPPARRRAGRRDPKAPVACTEGSTRSPSSCNTASCRLHEWAATSTTTRYRGAPVRKALHGLIDLGKGEVLGTRCDAVSRTEIEHGGNAGRGSRLVNRRCCAGHRLTRRRGIAPVQARRRQNADDPRGAKAAR